MSGTFAEKSKYMQLASTFLIFWMRPETHLPTNWPVTFSYLMYRMRTPGNIQIAGRQIDAMSRRIVLPIEMCNTVPF